MRESIEAEFKARLAEALAKQRAAAQKRAAAQQAAVGVMRERVQAAEREREQLAAALGEAQQALVRDSEASLDAQRAAEAAEKAAARAEAAQERAAMESAADGARAETALLHAEDAVALLEARVNEAEARANSSGELIVAHERAQRAAEADAEELRRRVRLLGFGLCKHLEERLQRL